MNKKVWNYILGSILILFGIIFLISPAGTFENIVLIGGIVLIVYGVVGIITAITSSNPLASKTVGSSAFSLIFGIILASNTNIAIKIIPVLLGIWLFVTGLSNLVLITKVTKDTKSLVGPITRIILGTFAFAMPIVPVVALGIFLGVVLILSGISTMINQKNDEVVYKVKVKK